MIEKKAVTVKSPFVPTTASGRPTPVTSPLNNLSTGNLFTKENYLLMLVGVIIIILGMMVMSGGKSNDPKIFDQKEVYSTTRITIAPILIVIGLGLEVFAIFKKPKVS